MSNYNPAGGGLQYRGTGANQPPNCFFDNRSPTQFDTQGFSLLDLWLNTVTGQAYLLVSLAGSAAARRSLAIWAPLSSKSGDLLSLTDQFGNIITPTRGNINIVGTAPITVTGVPSTSTITISVAAASTTNEGVVFLSSNSDTIAGVDSRTVVTPASLAAKLGVQTLDGVAYGGGTNMPLNWTALGASNTVLTGTGGAPLFSATPSVTSMTIAGNPTLPNQVANKAYVDLVASGFSFVAMVRLATTADLGSVIYANGTAGVGATLTNNGTQSALSIDGVLVNVSDRILVKNQSTQFQNGIYTVTTVGTGATNWVLTRSTDYDVAGTQIKPGNIVPVTVGTANANTLWLQTATVVTIGTDPIIFVPFGIEPIIPLPIDQGGTNAITFTPQYGVIYFDGTQLTATGAGTTGQVLTSANGAGAPSFMTPASGGGTITTTYNTPGTYTFTPNAATRVVEIYGWGSGAGGSGGTTPTTTVYGGGGGGGAFYYKIPLFFLPSSVNVIVAAGGAGGDPLGTGVGHPGQITSFGNFVSGNQPAQPSIESGNGGAGGFVFTQTDNSAFDYSVAFGTNAFPANTGRSNRTLPPDLNFGSMLPGGGGGGAVSQVQFLKGQAIINPATGSVIVAGGAAGALMGGPGGNGADGYVSGIGFMCGGGGGGAGTGSFAGGAGGNGGFPGGGGGAAALFSGAGGTGGTGGNGLVIVIEYT